MSFTNAVLGNPLVKDLLICTLCSRFFEDPRVLPCQHTFCLSCLQKQFQTSHASSRVRLSSLRCPTCFSAAAVPIRGITSFPQDKKIDKIKELLEGAMMTGVLRKARVENLEGRQRAGSKSRPNSWTGNIDVLAGNSVDDLNNMYPDVLKELNMENKEQQPQVKEVGTDTNEDEFYVNDKTKLVVQDCSIQTDIGGDLALNLTYEKTTKSENDGGRKRMRDTNQNQNGVSQNKRTCPGSEADSDNNNFIEEQKAGNNYKSGKQNDINGFHGNCTKEEQKHSEYLNSKQTASENYRMETDEVDNMMNGDTEDLDSPLLPPVFAGEPKLLWSVEKEDYDMPTSISMISTGNIIIGEYGNSKLQFYEPSGHYLQSVDEVKPFALAIDKEDNIVVADRKDKTIKVYHQLGELSYKWDDNCFHWIGGVGVTSSGNFVVFDREDCKIGVFSPEGDRIHQFGHYGDRDSHLCMADFLAVDSHDRILVCDSGHHCVKLYDLNGTFLGRFGERGNSEGYLLWPKSVCVDEANNILVTDQRNKRVNLYSPDGHFIQTVVKTKESPFNLGFHAPNTLAVTNFKLTGHSEILVYDL